MQCQTRQIQVFQPEVYNQQRWPSPGCTVTLGGDGALAVAETLCKPNKNTLELVNYATNIKIHNSKHQILFMIRTIFSLCWLLTYPILI